LLKKNYYKGGKSCRVWFYLPPDVNAEEAFLVGDFNEWNKSAEPMKKRKDGTFYTAVTLEVGKEYQFRYFLDNYRWENDWDADVYVPNERGTENSVVKV